MGAEGSRSGTETLVGETNHHDEQDEDKWVFGALRNLRTFGVVSNESFWLFVFRLIFLFSEIWVFSSFHNDKWKNMKIRK